MPTRENCNFLQTQRPWKIGKGSGAWWKIIERINNEKIELETISSKLDYIESAILMFKHQIISNASTEPIAEDIDNVINEAIALDNALTSHRNEN